MEKLNTPVVLKIGRSAEKKVLEYQQKLQMASQTEKAGLEAEIRNQIYGFSGEIWTLGKLSRSFLPMYILHDICLQYGGNTAQIDFIVITQKLVLILECKNWSGDVVIDQKGNFIRETNFSSREETGIKNPYTQNAEHLDFVYTLRRAGLKGMQLIRFNAMFEKYYKSVVVFTNDNTNIKMADAPDKIQRVVTKADMLVDDIKELHRKKLLHTMSDAEMLETAQFFLSQDITAKDNLLPNQMSAQQAIQQADMLLARMKKTTSVLHKPAASSKPAAPASRSTSEAPGKPVISRKPAEKAEEKIASADTDAIYEALRIHRNAVMEKEGKKPYDMCRNENLMEIAKAKPQTLAQLQKLDGFQEEWKCKKYGKGILKVLAQFQKKPAALASDKLAVRKSADTSVNYEALRLHRNAVTEKEGKKPYAMCTNDQLMGIAKAKPQTLAQLQKLDGFREEWKCKKYGKGILTVLARY